MATPPSRYPRTVGLVGPNGNGIGGSDHELRPKPAKPTKRPPILLIFRRSNRREATPPSRCPRIAGSVGQNRNGIGGPIMSYDPFFAAPEAVRYSPLGTPAADRTCPNPTERVRRVRSKSAVFRYIRERVWKRLQKWNQKLLSRAGKEILLKTVAQVLPIYAMNIYLLPMELYRELERMMNSFWWGRKGPGNGGIIWMKWERMCKPKTHGGIRFKRLHVFNVAMLGKQGWRLLTNPNILVARLFKVRYYPNTSFAEARLGSNPRYVWRSILTAHPTIIRGSRIQIGGVGKLLLEVPLGCQTRTTASSPRPFQQISPLQQLTASWCLTSVNGTMMWWQTSSTAGTVILSSESLSAQGGMLIPGIGCLTPKGCTWLEAAIEC